jgi:pantoate--beta-alanine ligase
MLISCVKRSALDAALNQLDRPIIFIPTMGALHQGHGELIRFGSSISKSVLVSAFINPLQFENEEDLNLYPRTGEIDLEVAKESGAKILWTPEYNDVYDENIEPISAGALGEVFEGASRKGHFDGVLTVVKKLFEIIKPDIAIFGEKDFQQLFLIKAMVTKLNLGVEIISHPVVRDRDGLALSSRNVRLSEKGRVAARVIYRSLQAANNINDPKSKLHEVLLSEKLFKLDYAEIIDERTFMVTNNEEQSSEIKRRAIIAGWIDGVRLIDTAVIA